MGNTLSYSKVRLFQECPKKYDYYYNKKLRERTKSGALFFGTAVDRAVEAVLKDRNCDETKVFDAQWEKQDINGEMQDLKTSLRVVYAATDFDQDLLTDEDLSEIECAANTLLPGLVRQHGGVYIHELFKHCQSAKATRSTHPYTEEENKFLNLCNWLSLRRKGHLILKANREKVLWRIKEVLRLQHKIELNNGEDSVIGYPDLVCIWEDGQPIVIDYKTSSIEYARDSVKTSPQLSIYCHAENIRRAGFIVFRKQILKHKTKRCSVCDYDGTGQRHKSCSNENSEGKRCGGEWNESIRPEVLVQIVIDEIPERTEEIVIENLDAVNQAIKNEIFVRNFNACEQGYGTCPYKALCFKNDKSELEDCNGKAKNN